MSKRKRRWDEMVEAAASVNHKVRVVVIAGDPKNGDPLTYVELEGSATDDLDEAVSRVERYLRTPQAREIGDAYRLIEMAKTNFDEYVAAATAEVEMAVALERRIQKIHDTVVEQATTEEPEPDVDPRVAAALGESLDARVDAAFEQASSALAAADASTSDDGASSAVPS